MVARVQYFFLKFKKSFKLTIDKALNMIYTNNKTKYKEKSNGGEVNGISVGIV